MSVHVVALIGDEGKRLGTIDIRCLAPGSQKVPHEFSLVTDRVRLAGVAANGCRQVTGVRKRRLAHDQAAGPGSGIVGTSRSSNKSPERP